MQLQMTSALTDLGVSPDTLTASDRASLDRDGYMIVPNILPKEQAAAMAARLDAIAAAEGANAGKDFQVEKGATRLGSLINKDPIFDVCFLHPRGLAAVNHIMHGDFGLSSITGRAAQPGEGHQGLHRDNIVMDSANILWAVSDFTPENGPTRLVPGSHLHPKAPHEAMEDSAARHPDEIYCIVPAGTLIVINGRTWHGGTRNGTNRPRHLISAFFLPRGRYQTESQRRLSEASQQRLSESARFVIDHEDVL
jgi:ectoine hydroxylase-related dioxygenase (phytanoyl-CoA dioxygenase family)